LWRRWSVIVTSAQRAPLPVASVLCQRRNCRVRARQTRWSDWLRGPSSELSASLPTRYCVAAAVWNGRRLGGGGCGLHQPRDLQTSALDFIPLIAYTERPKYSAWLLMSSKFLNQFTEFLLTKNQKNCSPNFFTFFGHCQINYANNSELFKDVSSQTDLSQFLGHPACCLFGYYIADFLGWFNVCHSYVGVVCIAQSVLRNSVWSYPHCWLLYSDVWNIFVKFLFGFTSVFEKKTRIWFGMSLVPFSLKNVVRFGYCSDFHFCDSGWHTWLTSVVTN